MKKYKNNLREKKYKIKCIDFMDVFNTKQFCLDKQKLISKSTSGTLKSNPCTYQVFTKTSKDNMDYITNQNTIAI